MNASKGKPTAPKSIMEAIEQLLDWEADLNKLRQAACDLAMWKASSVLTSAIVAKAEATIAFVSRSSTATAEMLAMIEAGLLASGKPLVQQAVDLIAGVCLSSQEIDKATFRMATAIKVAAGRPSKIALISAAASLIDRKWLPSIDEVRQEIAGQEERYALIRHQLGRLPELRAAIQSRLENERRLEERRQRSTSPDVSRVTPPSPLRDEALADGIDGSAHSSNIGRTA